MRKPPMHRIIRHLGNGMEQDKWHVFTDDRGRLQQLLVFRREPVDPRRQDHLHGCRNLHRLDRPDQTIRASLSGEHMRLQQRPDGFLDEEGIPAFDQQSLEGFQPGVVAQEGAQELARTLGWERVETQLAVVGLARPTVLVLGPVVHQEEHRSGGKTVHEAVEKRLRPPVDPVQVFTEQEQRLHLTLAQQQAFHRLQRLLTPLRWIECVPLEVVHWDVE